jgi:L-ribulose-5-phosphate 3-epimerase
MEELPMNVRPPLSQPSSRRQFLRQTAAAAAAGLATTQLDVASAADVATPASGKPQGKLELYKAVKWGMIADAPTVLDHFKICQELGYDGMELISPADFSAEEVRKASDATGLPVHGLVDMKHWDVRLSSPDAKVRDEGVAILRQAILDCHAFGGFSVLLVPGRVNGSDETHDHVWSRSIEGIRQVLPLASKLGVRVLIENVWNGFCETPEQLRDYLDEIANPWVGAYFDIGNVVKFSPSQNWIRTLGPRIVKLDVKDWSTTLGFEAKIGEGDVNWPAVRQALREIGFSGWCTAEVAGGDREWLADVAKRMDQTLLVQD